MCLYYKHTVICTLFLIQYVLHCIYNAEYHVEGVQ